MTKMTIVWIIVAASLVVLGGLLFVGAMTMTNWNFRTLSTVKYETNTYDDLDDFAEIFINTDTADISFLPSEDGKCKVVCYEEQKKKHEVNVEDGVLTVNAPNTKWYHNITIMNFDTPKIKVYLPKTEYSVLHINESTGDIEIPKDFSFESIDVKTSTGHVKNFASASGNIKISASTGDIMVENVSAGAIELSVTTGHIKASAIKCEGDLRVKVSTGKSNLTDISCNKLISNGSTGDISLVNVIAAESFFVERSTGNVKLDSCDAADIFITTDTGDIKGTLLSEKIFTCASSTGRVDVPNGKSGGACEITASTGDIIISIKE